MTTRAQKIVDATMELTLRPQRGDRAKVIAAAIRRIIDEFEQYVENDTYDELFVSSNDLYNLAVELENLKDT
jgi:hypothetical protein